TDDAQVDGHITPLALKVYGRVAQVLLDDNQAVKTGQVLVKIDARDYQAAVDQSKASLALAESEARSAGVDVPRTRENVASGSGLGARGYQAGAHEGRGCAGETRQGRTGTSGAPSGGIEFELHGDHRSHRWRGHAQAGGAGTDRPGRARIAGGCAPRERVGDGEFQRDPTAEHEGRAESRSEGGYLRQDLQRTSGFDCRGHRIPAEPAPSGKRHRKLRESGAADSRQDRAGPDPFPAGGLAAGNECGRDGDYQLNRE